MSPTTAFKASLPTEMKTHIDEGPVDLTRKTVSPPAHGGTPAQPVPKATDALDVTTTSEVTEDTRGQLLEEFSGPNTGRRHQACQGKVRRS